MTINLVRFFLAVVFLAFAGKGFAQTEPSDSATGRAMIGGTEVADTPVTDTLKYAIFGTDTIHPDSVPGYLIKMRAKTAADSSIIPDSVLALMDKSDRRKKKFQRGRTEFNPRKAWRRSLIIPGWGQIYNRRWWKVPIIYAGFGAAVGGILYNDHWYKEFRTQYSCSIDSACTEFDEGDQQILLSARDFYRRNRDLVAIGAGLWFALQLLDAYVDAHLRGFDVSDDLSLHWDPDVFILPNQRQKFYVGFNLSLRLRR